MQLRTTTTNSMAALILMPAMLQGMNETSTFLPGIDVHGNPTMSLGGRGAAKTFSVPRSGVTIQIAIGEVTNQSGRTTRITQRGASMPGKGGARIQVATMDQLIVDPPRGGGGQQAGRSIARQISVDDHVPLVCFMSRAADGTISCECRGGE